MKLAVIKITFKDGSIGYYKNKDIITSFKDKALKVDMRYAQGLCEGLNFAINTYQDELTSHAEVEAY